MSDLPCQPVQVFPLVASKAGQRRRIEVFLQEAAADATFTPHAIAAATELTVLYVRSVLNRLTRTCKVENVGQPHAPAYRWARPVIAAAETRPRWEVGGQPPADYWRKLQAPSTRPGALTAYSLPSVEGGQVRERRVPILLGSSVEAVRR